MGFTLGRNRTSGPAAASGYDAFISYSHQHDGVIGPALQAGLERFAKPWYRMRGMKVFRDSANLAANPALWTSIEDALSSSAWFILLASVDAAGSAWVEREVEWWAAHRPPGRLLVVATSPGLAWDTQKRDWAPGAQVPPALRGLFSDEPLWVDLSDVRLDGHRPNIPPDYLAALAAPIRGVPKDTIIGEHLREHRRTMRLARSAVAVLSVLLLLAVAATVTAVGQRDNARTQATIATSREVAALAVANVTTHADVAQLLAVAAFRENDNPQTEGALLQAVAASPHLVRYLQADAQTTALAASADGSAVVAGTSDGHLVWFSLSSGLRAEVKARPDSITNVAISADGGSVVAADGSTAVLWRIGQGRPETIDAGHSVTSVAVSPSGRVTAVLDDVNTSSPTAVVGNGHPGGVRIGVSADYTSVAFPSDSSLSLTGPSQAEQRSLPSLRRTSQSSWSYLPAGSYILGTSANGNYEGFSKYGDVDLWPTTGSKSNISAGPIAPDGAAANLEIAPDGKKVALTASGTIYVADVSSGQPPTSSSAIPLTGGGNITAVRFLGGDDRLVSSSGSSIELWDLGQDSRLSRPTGVSIPDAGTVGTSPTLAFSPDGRWLAIVGGLDDGNVSLYLNEARPTMMASSTGTAAGLPLWEGDRLLFLGVSAGHLRLTSGNGGAAAGSWSVPATYAGTPTARLLPGATTLAAVDSDGGIGIYDLGTGQARQVYPDQRAIAASTLELWQADIRPDGGAAVLTEWSGDTFTSPPEPLKVVYVDLRTGVSHVVGSGGPEAAVFAGQRLLVQRRTGTLEIWDPAGAHLLQTVPGPAGFTPTLAVSPDGSLLARLTEDGTASITDLATGTVLATFTLPAPADSTAADPWSATTLAFTPDGQNLLSATSGGELIRWTVASAALIQNACATAGRNLTAAEWKEYVQSAPPSDLSCAGAHQ